jgi:membrane-associated phospholipid phosphatase
VQILEKSISAMLVVSILASSAASSARADALQASHPPPPRGIKLAPSAILTGSLLGVSLASIFIPKPPRPNFVGPALADGYFRNALEQPTEELRNMHSEISDLGIWANAGIPLASYGLVAWASSKHRSLAQANRALIGFQAFFSNLLFTWALKTVVARERPVGIYGNDSFPSGHSSATFTGAFLLLSDASPFAGDDLKGWRYGLGSAALVVATATATLRMTAGRHYLTDVVAGAGFGFLFGYLYPILVGNGESEAEGFIPAQANLDPLYRDGPMLSISFRL